MNHKAGKISGIIIGIIYMAAFAAIGAYVFGEWLYRNGKEYQGVMGWNIYGIS